MRKGFTLLEVVLAIGIGALLTVTVLIASQGAQRSNRDAQRKKDLNKVSSALEQYADNHSGVYPAAIASGTFVTDGYINWTQIKDPNGTYGQSTTAPSSPCTVAAGAPAVIHYQTPDPSVAPPIPLRSWALDMCIEGGTYHLSSSQ